MKERKKQEPTTEEPKAQRKRVFGRDEREARETQRRATAYGRARGVS